MQPLSSRIKKGKSPFKRPLTENTYRKAKPFLKLEFGGRCCYSMLHCDVAGGDKAMDVEHFKPKKFPKAHSYRNLLYCSRHCNSSKGSTWPSKKERNAGFRFINPCEEIDYGVHIFEHIDTGILVAVSNAGSYQIEKCGLNAPFLIKARKQRTKIKKMLAVINVERDIAALSKFGISANENLNTLELTLKSLLDKEIPDIPPLPPQYEYLLEDFLPQ